MRKLLTTTMILMFAMMFPLMATASSDDHKMEHKMDKMEHGSMKHDDHDHGKHKMDHGDMDMKGMIMLGEETEDGVKAMAHLKDVKESMAKMGMKTTHHIMIMFSDKKTGEAIESGVAAVKIKSPDGKTSEAIKLMGMQGHFGADVELSQAGEYKFKIGTKLADGKKRKYEFEHKVK